MQQTYLPGDVRERIQDLIKEKKISQSELAQRIGLSDSKLSRFLSGKTKSLGDGYIIKIAKIFNVSTDFLLGETDIPERRNYDIGELGLSAAAARLLYTGKIDAEILNQLIENPRFPQLLHLLKLYQDESMKEGIATMNDVLTFSRSLFLGYAMEHPEDAADAKNAASDLMCLRTPPVTADTNTIQNLFMLIVRDMKQAKSVSTEKRVNATAETMDMLRQNLTKGESSLNLRKITEEDIATAVVNMVSQAGIPAEDLSELRDVLRKMFASIKVRNHDR